MHIPYLLDLVILSLHWCASTECRISHGRELDQNVSFARAGVFLSENNAICLLFCCITSKMNCDIL
jgi:hypothetical protein